MLSAVIAVLAASSPCGDDPCRVIWHESRPDGEQLDVALSPAGSWLSSTRAGTARRRLLSGRGCCVMSGPAKEDLGRTQNELCEQPFNVYCDVAPNSFKLSISGGRSGVPYGVEVSLSPFVVTSVTTAKINGGASPVENMPPLYTLEWPAGTPVARGHKEAPDVGSNKAGAKFWAVPLIGAPGFDWRMTLLGSCALALGARDTPGFVVAGKRAQEGSELSAVLTSPTDLVVDVPAALLRPADDGMNADHIELWQAPPIPESACCMAPAPRALQWAIGVDGSVHPGFGAPAPVVAERAWIGDVLAVHVKLALPVEDASFFGIARSRGDGKRVTSVVSNSEMTFGDTATLGLAWRVDPRFASCVVKNRKLEYERASLWSGDPSTPALR